MESAPLVVVTPCILSLVTHVHSERFEDIFGVLVNDALSALAERSDCAVVPPLSQVAVFVVLTTYAYMYMQSHHLVAR